LERCQPTEKLYAGEVLRYATRHSTAIFAGQGYLDMWRRKSDGRTRNHVERMAPNKLGASLRSSAGAMVARHRPAADCGPAGNARTMARQRKVDGYFVHLADGARPPRFTDFS